LWVYLMGDAIIFSLLLATMWRCRTTERHMLFRSPHLCGNHAAALEQRDLRFRQHRDGDRAAVAGRWQGWASPSCSGSASSAWRFQNSTAWPAAGADPERSGFLSAIFTLVGTHVGRLWIVALGGEVALRGLNPYAASRLYRLASGFSCTST
jgi:heme/copper-type cytochrome/quinol oxidase subunit 3